jgi:hypothetical protein
VRQELVGSELTIDTAAIFGGNECDRAEAPAHSIRWSALSCDEPRRRREAIFYDDADRVEFLRTLGQACLKSDRLRIGNASYVSNLLSSVDSKLTPTSDIALPK